MDLRISVLISAYAGTTHVSRAVEQVRRQSCPAHEILVLHGPGVPPSALARMRDLWPAWLVRWVPVAGDSPGAQRNAGVKAALGDVVVFVESGETIDGRYLESACERLASREDLAFVASWWRGPGASGLDTLMKPTLDLEAVLGDPDSIPGPVVFRRSAWQAAGGFDEGLLSAEWYEFWIRLLAQGSRGDVIEEVLVDHEPSRDSAYRGRLATDLYVAGMRAVFEKHLRLFRQHIAVALCDRERSLRKLAARYHGVLRQRDGIVLERDTLQQRLERTARELREMGQEGLDWEISVGSCR